jgi:5-formyltetrahydrofolate cyclo-ligase
MNTVKEKKIAVRQELFEKRRQLESSLKQEMDKRICNYIISLATYRYSDAVLFYYPLKGEVDVTYALEKAWSDKKTVLLPRCRKEKNGIMDFYVVSGVQDLEAGAFGVMEPKESCTLFPKENLKDSALCIMPALTFDKKGYRLGYGKGYYDRYLCLYPTAKRIGYCFDFQLVSEVPHDEKDEKLDFVVTDKQVVETMARKA